MTKSYASNLQKKIIMKKDKREITSLKFVSVMYRIT